MKINKQLVVLVLAGPVCSCSAIVADFAKAEEDLNRAEVEASIFTLCEMASVGAIRREFKTAEQVKTWKMLCSNNLTDLEPSPKGSLP